MFHRENGVLGMGPAPAKDEDDPELINAGKQLRDAACRAAPIFHHADSFAMIRGGHLGSVRARRVPGGGERRHRQLGHQRERYRAGGRRRDGPRRRRSGSG